MVSYEKLTPLSPPRPEKAVPREMIGSLEKQGYLGQVKKNGQYSVVYVSPEREITVLNRHLEPHKNWKPSEEKMGPFLDLPGDGWYVFCAELLHAKVTGIRDVHYVHDILVEDGEWLLGETYAQRYRRLQSILLHPGSGRGMERSHWVVDDHVWVARNHRAALSDLFDSLDSAEDEGLVLKDPNHPLGVGAGRGSVKVRRHHKNFGF